MKKKITQDEAIQMLLNSLDREDFGDRVYELAHGLFGRGIDTIERNCEIIGADGTPYKDEDDVAWYDDAYEEFFDKCYENLIKFLTAKY